MLLPFAFVTAIAQPPAPRLVPQRRIEHDEPDPVEFSPDGRYVYVNDDNVVLVYDLRTGLQRDHFWPRGDRFSSVALAPDGNRLLVVEDGTVAIYDVWTHALIEERILQDKQPASSAFWSVEGKRVLIDAYGADKKQLRFLWDLSAKTLTPQGTTLPEGFRFEDTPPRTNPTELACWEAKGVTYLGAWRKQKRTVITRLDYPAPRCTKVATHPHLPIAIEIRERSMVNVWDTDTLRMIHSGKPNARVPREVITAEGGAITIVAADSTEETLSNSYTTLRAWDHRLGREIWRARTSYGTLAISEVAGIVMVGSRDVFDLRTGKAKPPLAPENLRKGNDAPSVGAGGKRAVFRERHWTEPKREVIVDLTSGAVEPVPFPFWNTQATFSASGKTIALIDQQRAGYEKWANTLVFYDVASHAVRHTDLKVYSAVAPLFAVDEHRVFVVDADRKSVLVVDTQSLQTVQRFTSGGRLSGVALSPDGRMLLLGSTQDGITALDAFSGAALWTLAEPNIVANNDVRFASSDFVYSIGRDAIAWIDARTGQLRLKQYIAGDDMLFVDSEGHYSGSRGTFASYAFDYDRTAYPFDQFDAALNRPDLVAQALPFTSAARLALLRAVAERRQQRVGVTHQRKGLALPTVSLASAPPPMSTKSSRVSLTFEAKANGVPLKQWLVAVNNVPVGPPIAVDAPDATRRTIDIVLGEGSNPISVSVQDAEGNESLRQNFLVNYSGKPAPRRTFVLSVGVSKYKDSQYDLSYAAKDARDMANELSRRGRGVQTLVLTDEAATKAQTLAARSFLSRSTEDDTIIVFLAGHGLLDDRMDYHFATHDVDFASPRSGLSYDDIEGLLASVRARRRLVLMDTCFSGEAQDGAAPAALAQGVRARAVGTRGLLRAGAPRSGLEDVSTVLAGLFTDIRRGAGAFVISSAGGAEYALESSDWNNGVFTFAFLDGLRTGAADDNHDGRVSVVEARDTLIRRVAELTGGAQRPTARRDNPGFDFDLVKAAEASPQPRP